MLVDFPGSYSTITGELLYMTDLLCFLTLVPVSLSDDSLLAREQLLPFNCFVSGTPSDGAETRNKDILSDIL